MEGNGPLDGIWPFGGLRVPLRGNAGTTEMQNMQVICISGIKLN